MLESLAIYKKLNCFESVNLEIVDHKITWMICSTVSRVSGESNLKMEPISLIICSRNCYIYDNLAISNENVAHKYCCSLKNIVKKKQRKALPLDSAFVHYFIKELNLSEFYRCCVIRTFKQWFGPDFLLLLPTSKNLIDYNWNERICEMIRERCEIDHTLSWLSTLGGAFSALGDYFPSCADTAGKISLHQLQLAHRLRDPNVQSRCRLYLSLSLIQKKKFKLAMKMVQTEYRLARNQIVADERLLKMCQGIWAKLQYEYSFYKNNKINR